MTAQEFANLTSLLYPKSVAITGATQNPEDLGSYVLRNIIYSNYKGRIFPVCQTVDRLYEFDTYASIRDISEEVDLAILATEADRVIDDVSDCTKAKVRNICIISRGCFAESGKNGLVLQKKIRKIANDAGIRVLGPNSLGIISTSVNLNATFAPSTPKQGKAVFMSQSGALINGLIDHCKFYNLGLSEVIGLGNKSDISEIDLLKYYSSLRQNGQPSVVGAYLENITDGTEFIDICSRFCKNIPLITLIPSESRKACEYIYAHTGSIVQRDEVIDLALKQSGVIRAFTQEQLYDLILAFSWQVPPRGDKIAIVSNAEGGLIIAIDDIYRYGLKLVNFSQDVKHMLTKEFEARKHGAGVVDLGGQALSLNYLKALDVVLADSEVNAVVVILSPQIMTEVSETAEAIGRLAKEHGKTIVAAFLGYEEVGKGIKALAKYFVPTFNSVERAIFALSKMYQYGRWKEQGGKVISKFSYFKPFEKERSQKILAMLEQARVARKLELEFDRCLDILRSYEIDTSFIKKVKSLKDVVSFGEKYGYPVEFYCLDSKRATVLRSSSAAKEVFESHFKDEKNRKQHSFVDHVMRAIRVNKKVFTISIYKDTYYEHLDKGFNLKELARLGFGYYFKMAFKTRDVSTPIEALLPLSRDQVEHSFISSRFLDELAVKKGEQYDKLKNALILFIQKVIRIPMDFTQIAAIELGCICQGEKVYVVDCDINLDLVV